MKKLFFILPALSVVMICYAQPGQQETLKKRQAQLQQQLDSLNNVLAQIKKGKNQSFSQLAIIDSKIKLRRQMINNLANDVQVFDTDIAANTAQVTVLQHMLDTLKQGYAKSIAFAYKNRNGYDYLNFLFSAQSFNDAIKRVAYLKNYRHNRELQADKVKATEQLLQQKITQLTNIKADKTLVLDEQANQLKTIHSERAFKQQVLNSFKNQEAEVKASIKKAEKTRADLRNALAQAIKRDEARLAAENEVKTKLVTKGNITTESTVAVTKPKEKQPMPVISSPGKAGTKPIPANPTGGMQAINFINHKGSLPWPVSNGFVSIHYGLYEINNIRFFNDGITIALPIGSTVKAVADGEVSAVADIGGQNVVIIRHGKYYTTYSNLATTNVNRGDKVNAGTVIGTAGKSETGEGQLQFDVSNAANGKNTFSDPEVWLRHR